MDISDTHKSKVNVAINRIGTMMDMTDFLSLCIKEEDEGGGGGEIFL
jgi:hypothetical protein